MVPSDPTSIAHAYQEVQRVMLVSICGSKDGEELGALGTASTNMMTGFLDAHMAHTDPLVPCHAFITVGAGMMRSLNL